MAHSIRQVGGSQRGAGGRSVYVPDDVHARIWKDPSGQELPAPRLAGGNVGRFPFLSRLADPYLDATIWPAEVGSFKKELLRVSVNLPRGSREAAITAQLVDLAVEAESNGWSLECLGD
jgi:hypothetical protein